MDPISFFLIMAASQVSQNFISTLIGNYFSGVLQSYIANQIPNLRKKASVESILNKTYKRAVKEWSKKAIVEKSILIESSDNHEQLITSIKNGDIESAELTELYHIWIHELEKEEIGRWFIENIKIDDIKDSLSEIKEHVSSTEEHVSNLLNELESQIIGKTSFEQITDYIPRSCYKIREEFAILAGIKGDTLYNLVLESDKKQIVLFASPFMGKTTELKQLCWLFSTNEDYMPILYELKHFSGVITKDKLPKNDIVKGKKIILVIDALDEVSEYKFSEQMKEISGYADLHPKMPIVLSCRSNYLHLVNRDNFMIVGLGALTSDQVRQIVASNKAIVNKEQFLSDIMSSGLSELTDCPFYLKELMGYYESNGGLPNTRTEVFDYLIKQSYRVEDKKQVSGSDLMIEEERRNLERIAVVMQMTGHNAISRNDLLKCLKEKESTFNKTNHFGVLNYSEQEDSFSFNYNTIKEYLAASFLASKPLDQVMSFVCVENSKRVPTQWYNTICLYAEIVSIQNNGKMPEDVYDWLSKDNKGLLLQTNKRFVSSDVRPQLLIDFIKEQNDSMLFIERIGSKSMESIVEFGMGINLVQFLLNELKSLNSVDIKIANLVGVAKFIDWDFLYRENASLANELENALLPLIDRFLLDGQDSWVCIKWILNKSIKNKAFLKKIVQKAIESENQDLINHTLVAIANADCADYFYNDIKQMQSFVSGDIGAIGRQNVYSVYGLLENPDNISDAFSYITKSSFYYKDYSMDDYRRMEKSLLRKAELIAKEGNPRIAETIKNAILERFSSIYGFKNFGERKAVANDYRQFYVNIGKWNDVSTEVDGLFQLNEKRNVAIRQEENIKKQYDELMSEVAFRDNVFSIVNREEEIDLSDLWNEHGITKPFIYEFLCRYTRRVDGNLYIDKKRVKEAVLDRSNYFNFMFEKSMEIMEGKYGIISLDEGQLSQVIEFAKVLVFNACNNNSLGLTDNQQKAIDLMLKGSFSIPQEYLLKLIRFSGYPFSLNMDIWDENICPLFDLICEHNDIDEIKKIIEGELVDNMSNVSDINFKIWSSFAIRSHLKDTYSSIMDRIIKKPDEALLIHRQLCSNVDLQERIIIAAEDGSFKDLQVLVTLLKEIMAETPIYNSKIQDILENKINKSDLETAKTILPILVAMGSKPALLYLEEFPNALESCVISTFNYTDTECVDKLIELYEHYFDSLPIDHIFNPCQAILNNIIDIALISTENQKDVELKLKGLTERRGELKPFINKSLLLIQDLAAMKYFRKEGIEDALDWIGE